MKNTGLIRLAGFLAFFVMPLLWGCTSEISFTVLKDGSVEGIAVLEAGSAFSSLIRSATGSDEIVFQTDEIDYELVKNGFSKVSSASKKGTDLSVRFSDKNQTSALFKSGICKIEGGALKISLSPAVLLSFYEDSDGQIQQFLDLLLSPVFNDEEMDESEYLDLVASVYGKNVASEIQDSILKIFVTNSDNTKKTASIPLSKLLTLHENLIIF